MNALSWIILAIACTGSVLVGQKDRKWHLAGFYCWVMSNTYWIIYNAQRGEWVLVAQFAAFLGTCIPGIINNTRYLRNPK